jgi:hypothetical protein
LCQHLHPGAGLSSAWCTLTLEICLKC